MDVLRGPSFLALPVWGLGLSVHGLVLLVVIMCSTEIHSALLCSQCTSGPNGTCVTSPPSATECPHSSHNVNCMITKTYSDNGTLLQFSRGCTMVRVSEGCVEQNNNITLCYVVCHTDNCNHSSGVTMTTITMVLSLGFIWIINPL